MGFWRCSGRSSSSNQHQHQQRRQQQQRRQRQRQQVALPWGSGAWLRRHSVAHRFSSSKCARGGWGRGKGGSVRFVAAAADASWWRWRRAPPPMIRPHRSRRPAADSRPVRHGGVRVAPARARGRRDVPAAGGVPAEEAPPFLGFLRRRSSTATTQGSRGVQ